LRKLFAWIDRAVEYAVAAIFAAMCLVGLLQVFNRFVLNRSLSWSEEFQIYCHVWIVFLAIPIAYRYGAHMSVDSLRNMAPQREGEALAEVKRLGMKVNEIDLVPLQKAALVAQDELAKEFGAEALLAQIRKQ